MQNLASSIVGYNTDITVHEVSGALLMTKQESSPGPDGIFPKFITKLDSPIPLHHLTRCCWSQARFPIQWKEDNRIYGAKSDKDDYHIEKAYRPISLTAVCGKMYERILARRLLSQLRETGMFNHPQFAYLKGQDTTQALLTLTLHIQHNFKEGKSTAAAMIDLEGAFDAVWRNGVMYKLHKLGINGRLWLTIFDFFKNRRSRNKINSHTSDWVSTDIGVPQGSILAVILFIVFVFDLAIDTNFHVKYADDLYVLFSHQCMTTAASELTKDLQLVNAWCTKWRQSCSQSKTEVMAFHPSSHIDIVVTFKGAPLKQVTEKKALGVLLDENLNFSAQCRNAESKSLSALRKISVFLNELGGASMEVMLTL